MRDGRTRAASRAGLKALVALALSAAPLVSQEVVRGPYLQRGTHDSIVVRWRTDVPTDSRVAFGSTAGALDQAVTDATNTTEHRVVLTGLDAETRYVYSVGTTAATLAGGAADHAFRTSPMPGVARPTRVWVVGDSGKAGPDARAVRDAYAELAGDEPTDLWLMLGDNAYDDGTDAEYQVSVFEDMHEELLARSVVWPTLGNHDARTADSSTESGAYYDIFDLPRGGEAGGVPSGTEAYYAFDHGDIHFVCLDSAEGDLSPGSAMASWLAADTAATTARWIIAFWHHPPYTKGSHDSDDEGKLIDMREVFVPLLEDAGVDLVLTGHSHSYERSMLLDGHHGDSGTLGAQHLLDDGDGDPAGDGAYVKATLGFGPHEGAVYVVAGSSSKLSSGPLDHPVMARSLKELGSLVLDIDGSRLDGRFLDDAGVVRDSFRIVKGSGDPGPPDPPGPPTLTEVLLGDRAEGLLTAGAEAVHVYRFAAVAGTEVDLSASSPDASLRPGLELRDPEGALLVSADASVVSAKKARIKGLVLEATGTYELVVRDVGEGADLGGGVYRLRTRGDAPRKQVDIVAVTPDAPEALVTFDALAGARLEKLVVKRLKAAGPHASVDGVPSRLSVNLAGVDAPGGSAVPHAEHLSAGKGGKKLTLTQVPLPDGGTYGVRVTGADGSVGWARVVTRPRQPRGKTTHVVP